MKKGDNEVKYENVAVDEKPPVCDHGEEKRAALSKIFLEFLGIEKSKSPDVLEIRVIVTHSLMLSFVFQIILVVLSSSLGDNAVTLASVSLVILMAGIIEFHTREHISPKFFSVYYGQFLVNLILAGYGIIVLWSPSFCPNMASWFIHEQCQNFLGFLRAVGSLVLIFNVVFQAGVLRDFRTVYEYVKMAESRKKQPIWVVLPNPK